MFKLNGVYSPTDSIKGFIPQNKICLVCGTKYSNKQKFCDNECKQVYQANKEFIDNNQDKGVYFL